MTIIILCSILFIQISAIAILHDHDIVHRDLKPGKSSLSI